MWTISQFFVKPPLTFQASFSPTAISGGLPNAIWGLP
jgi:hypothetical protein